MTATCDDLVWGWCADADASHDEIAADKRRDDRDD